MIHPDTELRHIDAVVGYGVFATKLIPRGTITYVKDDLETVVSLAQYASLVPEMQAVVEKYSYIDEGGNRIVSWDFAKYINHCCNCNSISTGYGFEIAIRDILPGEQITDEYGVFNLTAQMDLVCGQPGCRGLVAPTDFDHYYQQWDAKITAAFPDFFRVNQPLFFLLDEATLQPLASLEADPGAYRSVYKLRYFGLTQVSVVGSHAAD